MNCCVVLRVGTARPNQLTRTIVQENVAWGARMIEGIRGLGYQGKHKKRMAHSRDELPGSKVMNSEIQGRGRRAGGQRRTTFNEGKVV